MRYIDGLNSFANKPKREQSEAKRIIELENEIARLKQEVEFLKKKRQLDHL